MKTKLLFLAVGLILMASQAFAVAVTVENIGTPGVYSAELLGTIDTNPGRCADGDHGFFLNTLSDLIVSRPGMNGYRHLLDNMWTVINGNDIFIYHVELACGNEVRMNGVVDPNVGYAFLHTQHATV